MISLCCLHDVQHTSALQTPSSIQPLELVCMSYVLAICASALLVYIPLRVENLDISALEKFVDELKQLLPAAQPGKVLTMTTELIAEGLTDSSH